MGDRSRRRLVVEADGGSRGNPGVAGYGALVRDADTGVLLAERAEPLGRVSNNVAEYRGLLAGLDAAYRIDPGAQVQVRMDSKLVVEQMSGRWKIKHEDMQRLAAQARELVTAIRQAGGAVRFEWIPRERNKAADALSNVAMDGESVDRFLDADPAVDDVTPEPQPAGRDGFARPDAPTRVVLVRHGVTDFTVEGRLDGRGGPDPDLNEQGRTQAARAASTVAHLLAGHPARVVTSTLARARQTGAAVADALGVEAVVDADLDEQSFGDWDGARVHDLVRGTAREDFLRLRDDPSYARPGGESHDDLTRRVLAAFERAVALGGTSVLVCHRKPIMVVLGHLLSIPPSHQFRLAAAPGSISAVELWPHGEVSVAFTNRT